MVRLWEALEGHARVEPEDRVVPERVPGRVVPDRPPKLCPVVLLEPLGLDAGRVVSRRDGRVVGVFGAERNANWVGRLHLDLREGEVKLVLKLAIPSAASLFLFFIFGFFRVPILRQRLLVGLDILLLLRLLGLWLLLVAAGFPFLPLIARAALPAPVILVAILVAIVVGTFGPVVLLMPAPMRPQRSLIRGGRGRWRKRVIWRDPARGRNRRKARDGRWGAVGL